MIRGESRGFFFCPVHRAFLSLSHCLDGLDGLDRLEGPRLSRGIDDQGGNWTGWLGWTGWRGRDSVAA